jgi:hypothetical protein
MAGSTGGICSMFAVVVVAGRESGLALMVVDVSGPTAIGADEVVDAFTDAATSTGGITPDSDLP